MAKVLKDKVEPNAINTLNHHPKRVKFYDETTQN